MSETRISKPERPGPHPACAAIRRIIEGVGFSISNIDVVPGINDPGYDEFEEHYSTVLASAVDAYDSRPADCRMTIQGDKDIFECDRCGFDVHTFPTDL